MPSRTEAHRTPRGETEGELGVELAGVLHRLAPGDEARLLAGTWRGPPQPWPPTPLKDEYMPL